MASFPTSVKSWTALVDASDYPQAAHLNEARDEINAIEAGYLNGTARLNSSNSTMTNLSVTGGSTLASLNSSNSTVANLSVSGGSTLAGLLTVTAYGAHSFSASGAAANSLTLENTNAGAGYAQLIMKSRGATDFTLTAEAGLVTLEASLASGLILKSSHASGPIRFDAGGSTRRMLIDTTGIVTMDAYGAGTATFSAAGVISSVSDERLKDDIRPLGYGLAEVMALDPIRYFWTDASGLNDPAHTEYGSFGAANVKSVMPLAVGQDASGYLTLSDRPILGAAVNAIKELHARIAQIERKAA